MQLEQIDFWLVGIVAGYGVLCFFVGIIFWEWMGEKYNWKNRRTFNTKEELDESVRKDGFSDARE